jgi:MEMO1 family protein
MSTVAQAQLRIRPPAVAGFFYPDEPTALRGSVRTYLAEADSKIPPRGAKVPKAIIAPHAGYVYSGLTAAAAYRTLTPAKGTISRVVMMGPCHRVAVRGIALSSADAFRTPLGDVAVDKEAVAAIRSLPGVETSDATHKDDHALEVHLPFLQEILGTSFTIVPMIVGGARQEDVARVLETLWGGPETLILISSDLSHYMPYDAARSVDDAARQAIERLDPAALSDEQACGRHSIKGLLQVARAKGLNVATADVRNSGDTAGDRARVVGYGSWLFTEEEARLSGEDSFGGETRTLLTKHGTGLLKLAASAILSQLRDKKPFGIRTTDYAPELNRKGASFVSLERDGKLCGCVGSIVAHRPLLNDVGENACHAAFKDRRFSPLTLDEIAQCRIDIHISILSPQVQMSFTSEDDLLAQIRPGRDGLVLQDGSRRGVFLPVVWDAIPDPKQFLAHLKRKAGLPETHWSDTVQVWRYVTEEVRSETLPTDVKLWA